MFDKTLDKLFIFNFCHHHLSYIDNNWKVFSIVERLTQALWLLCLSQSMLTLCWVSALNRILPGDRGSGRWPCRSQPHGESTYCLYRHRYTSPKSVCCTTNPIFSSVNRSTQRFVQIECEEAPDTERWPTIGKHRVGRNGWSGCLWKNAALQSLWWGSGGQEIFILVVSL